VPALIFRLKPEATHFRLKPEATHFQLKPEATHQPYFSFQFSVRSSR
jgi:hypothetical protein